MAIGPFVHRELPAHKALLRVRMHVLSAQHQFERYDQRERIGVREVQLPMQTLKKIIGGLGNKFTIAIEPVRSMVHSYVDEESLGGWRTTS